MRQEPPPQVEWSRPARPRDRTLTVSFSTRPVCGVPERGVGPAGQLWLLKNMTARWAPLDISWTLGND